MDFIRPSGKQDNGEYVGTDSCCQRYNLYPLAVSKHSRGEFDCLYIDKSDQWWRFEYLVIDRKLTADDQMSAYIDSSRVGCEYCFLISYSG